MGSTFLDCNGEAWEAGDRVAEYGAPGAPGGTVYVVWPDLAEVEWDDGVGLLETIYAEDAARRKIGLI